MYRRLDPAVLACTELKGASCLLNILTNYVQDGLAHHSPHHLANPNGSNPWVLVEGDVMSRDSRYASSDRGSTNSVATRRAELASASHSESDASENIVHIHLHASASTPDGPAAP
eukprot:scpid29363/ scgid26642/ 